MTLTSQRDLTNLVVGGHPHTSHNMAKHTNNKIKKTRGEGGQSKMLKKKKNKTRPNLQLSETSNLGGVGQWQHNNSSKSKPTPRLTPPPVHRSTTQIW